MSMGGCQKSGLSARAIRDCGRGLARSIFSALVATACGALLSVSLHAKVAAGISGIITDSTGAVVSGATIQMKDLATGVVQSRQANQDGFYAFIDLQPGHYDMQVTQA